MVTTMWNMMWENTETSKVMNYMMGRRTVKQIVWEFFWLREEAVYDDNWDNIIDFISDFKDLVALKSKKVRYVPRLAELWVSEQEFNKLFLNWLPTLDNNDNKNGKIDWWEQDNTWNTGKTKKK